MGAETKNQRPGRMDRVLKDPPGSVLLSQGVSPQVPSALAGLTSVFGMGTGVTLPTKSPENFSKTRKSK